MNTYPSLRWYPGSEKVCWVDDDKLALVNGAGVHLYLGGRDNVSSGTRTFAYLNKDFPTGYLTNVNPVATCASTSTESLTASTQLLSNGTFASNITGWTDKSSGASNIAHDSSNQRMTMNGNAATARAHTTITTVVGEWYMVWTKPISSLFSGTTHSLEMYVGTHEYPNGNYSYIGQSTYTHGTSDANEPIAITWKAVQTTYHILFQTGHDKAIDNVYAMRVAEDVSSNNPMLDNGNGDFYVSGQPLDRGFRVFGTVARTPAATGSEIVTYNFGNGSYLEQPYNSELNFLQNAGNSFTAMAWASPKVTQTGGSPWHPLISLEHWDGSNTDWYCGAHGKMAFSGTEIGNTVLEANQLYFLVWTRNGPTGTNYVYVNGRLDGSNTSPDPVAASNQTLLIGCRHANGQKSTDTGGSVTDGSHWNKVALVRISQGYTDATMINKIYNEERKLFHPNAKCTLDKENNLLRGISYDKDTELMHALTSNSRSDFNGLVRINSEDRASAGVAGHRCISSVNGMIVEEE